MFDLQDIKMCSRFSKKLIQVFYERYRDGNVFDYFKKRLKVNKPFHMHFGVFVKHVFPKTIFGVTEIKVFNDFALVNW